MFGVDDIKSAYNNFSTDDIKSAYDKVKSGFSDDRSAEKIGIGEFTAYATVTESSEWSADLTQKVVETGYTVSDHRIKKPRTIELEGVVSDKFISGESWDAQFKSLASGAIGAVGLVSKYLPGKTQSQIQKLYSLENRAENAFNGVKSYVNEGQSLLKFAGLVTGSEGEKTITDKFYTAMNSYFDSGLPIQINAPKHTYKSMVITSLTMRTDNQLNNVGFTLRATELKIASTQQSVTLRGKSPSKDTQGALDGEKKKGPQQGDTKDAKESAFSVGGILHMAEDKIDDFYAWGLKKFS